MVGLFCGLSNNVRACFIPVTIKSQGQPNVLPSDTQCTTVTREYWQQVLPCYPCCYGSNGSDFFEGANGTKTCGSITSSDSLQRN